MIQVRMIFTVALAACVVTAATAADKFSFKVIPGIFYGRYDGSQYRDQIHGANVNVEGQLTNKWRFAAGYERTRILYKFGLPAYQQDAVFLSGHTSYTPQSPVGTYTFRLDYHYVSDDDGKSSADNARVIAPQISYKRRNSSLYLDLGYADSRYGTCSFVPGALRIRQWTPTLGIALTQNATNWLKLRGYFIHSDNPSRSQHKKHTTAWEAKYSYYPMSRYRLIPLYIEASAVAGERIYAVDRDTASVANLADLEKGGISLSAQWRLTTTVGLLIAGNRTQFREQTYFGYNDYIQQSAWLGLVMQW
jgi:hypothetical protein